MRNIWTCKCYMVCVEMFERMGDTWLNKGFHAGYGYKECLKNPIVYYSILYNILYDIIEILSLIK